jgi:hypothetical protein
MPIYLMFPSNFKNVGIERPLNVLISYLTIGPHYVIFIVHALNVVYICYAPTTYVIGIIFELWTRFYWHLFATITLNTIFSLYTMGIL